MSAPDDIRSDLLWYREDIPNGHRAWAEPNPEAHEKPCRVYWGSHGCARPRGHEGAHWCDCCDCTEGEHPHPGGDTSYLCVAGPPYYGPDTKFFGEDV